eukprot:SAG31_NODE_11754_length_1001_cov_0.957871_1_plen_310_part_10
MKRLEMWMATNNGGENDQSQKNQRMTDDYGDEYAKRTQQDQPKPRRRRQMPKSLATSEAATSPLDDRVPDPPENAVEVDHIKVKSMCNDGSLTGRRLSLYWGGDHAWYSGTVLSCGGDTFQLRYDDREISWENVDAQVGIRLHANADPNLLQQKLLAVNITLRFGLSELRVTGDAPPRIALKDFIECVIGKDTSSLNSTRGVIDLMAKVRGALKKEVTKHTFAVKSSQSAVENFGANATKTDKLFVVPVAELGRVMALLPLHSCSRIHETGDLHRLQRFLRQETGIHTLELRIPDTETSLLQNAVKQVKR